MFGGDNLGAFELGIVVHDLLADRCAVGHHGAVLHDAVRVSCQSLLPALVFAEGKDWLDRGTASWKTAL